MCLSLSTLQVGVAPHLVMGSKFGSKAGLEGSQPRELRQTCRDSVTVEKACVLMAAVGVYKRRFGVPQPFKPVPFLFCA